jgi:hypothetical protein
MRGRGFGAGQGGHLCRTGTTGSVRSSNTQSIRPIQTSQLGRQVFHCLSHDFLCALSVLIKLELKPQAGAFRNHPAQRQGPTRDLYRAGHDLAARRRRCPRTARRCPSGTPEAPYSATRSDSIRAASTFWPASMHRPRKAWRTSRKTPCTGNEICTWVVGNARSAGFMRDFISAVPFFACKAPGCSHPGERNRHLHLIRSTEFGISPPIRRCGQ